MIFPIAVIFDRKLNLIVNSDNSGQILQYIKDAAAKSKADNLVIEDMSVTYKGSTSYWRGSLFQIIDRGIFTLIYKDNSWYLRYQINMQKLFVQTAIMSAFVGILSAITASMWWVGIIAFLWLCGGNWVIACLRHGLLATEIATEADELIGGKKPALITGEKDESLKSWF